MNANSSGTEVSIPPKPKPLRCVVYPGEGMGARINCEDVCRKVCNGQVDCPCNDNTRGVDCWVPRESAKQYCDLIDDCHVISMYRGSPNIAPAVPHLKAWANLGTLPVSSKKGYVASVCDKATAGVCYSCPGGNGPRPLREACHRQTYSTLYDHEQPFCAAGGSNECMSAADAKACTKTTGYCSTDTGECVPEAPLCMINTLKSLIAKGGTACEQWVADSLSRRKPSLGATCSCLKSIQDVLGTKTGLAYECAIVPNTHTLAHMAKQCEDVGLPCTKGDGCSGCTQYKSTPTDTGVVAWLPLKVPGTSKRCDLNVENDKCVLVGVDKTLRPHMPCAGDISTLTFDDDDYYIIPPEEGAWGRGADGKSEVDNDPSIPMRGSPHISGVRTHPAANASIEEVLGAPPPPEGLPVDFNHSDIGNAIDHRHYMDGHDRTVNVVLTCNTFPEVGTVDSWSLYSGRAEARVHAQVLRPVTVPNDLETNPHKVTAYNVVGENVLHVTSAGASTFVVPAEDRIDVQPGDVIGFYSRGAVSWSEGGEHVLFRYGAPSNPTIVPQEMNGNAAYSSDSLVFVGDGVIRTYSFRANGQFPGYHVAVSPSPSPSPTPAPSPSAHASESRLPSPSPSPSPSLSIQSRCTEGPAYYCQDKRLRIVCHITERVYNRSCTTLPKCDPNSRCPVGQLPKTLMGETNVSTAAAVARCFDPATDCAMSPCARKTGSNNSRACDMYAFNNVHGFSDSIKPLPTPEERKQEEKKVATSPPAPPPTCPGAPYCSGGQDWTGRCANGKMQSPIKVVWDALVNSSISTMQVVDTNYAVEDAVMMHVGWGMVMSGDFGSITMDGDEYDAVAVAIHSPAEHQVEGQPRSDIEIQIMHNLRYTEGKKGGETLGVAIFLDSDEGAGNCVECVKMFAGRLPSEAGESRVVRGLDLNTLVDKSKPRVLYTGSLTTPPCSEGVKWSLQMGTNARVGKEYVNNLNQVFKSNPKFAAGRGNNRGLQSLNGRTLSLKSSCGANSAIACDGSSSDSSNDGGDFIEN